MSGDKTTAQEQATGSLGQMAPGQGTQHCAAEDRKVACSHWALCSSGGVQEVDFQEMDRAQNVSYSHPSPQRNNPLWHERGGGGGWARPRGKSNRKGTPEGKRQEPVSLQAPAEGPGPGHSCIAKSFCPTPELPSGGAMHSNAEEKSDGVRPEPPGTGQGFAEPS